MYWQMLASDESEYMYSNAHTFCVYVCARVVNFIWESKFIQH